MAAKKMELKWGGILKLHLNKKDKKIKSQEIHESFIKK
jgi:hypothetical protein